MKEVNVGPLAVKAFESRPELMDYALERGGILVAVNAEKTVNAQPRLIELVRDNIGYCDGAGAVKAVRRKGAKKAIRIPGCELWLDFIENHNADRTFYLVGSRPEVVGGVVYKLRKRYPKLHIVGHRDGFLRSEDEKQELIDDIAAKRPDIVFVAMGSPKQEYLMQEMLARHHALYQGLGGSFDLYMGLFRRAPRWVRSIGCEWLWRFVAQPSRLRRITPYLQFAARLYTGRL